MSEKILRISRGLVGCALIVATGAATGCTDRGSANKKDPAAAPSATQPSITPEMPKYIAAADKANAASEGSVVSAAARPTVTIQNSKITTMVIRDEGKDTWAPGNYRLVIYCVGTGTLYGHFKLGSTAQIAEIPPCGPTATTGAVDVKLAAAANSSAVVIVPAGDVQAAVAYQIQRL